LKKKKTARKKEKETSNVGNPFQRPDRSSEKFKENGKGRKNTWKGWSQRHKKEKTQHREKNGHLRRASLPREYGIEGG